MDFIHTTVGEQRDGQSQANQHPPLNETAAQTSGWQEVAYRPKRKPVVSENEPIYTSGNVSNNVPNRDPGVDRAPLTARGLAHRKSESVTAPDLQHESADEMLLRLSNEFQAIIDPEWDTVIYIGPPPQEYMQDDHEYEYIKQHFSKPYLMNSQELKDSGSAQFAKYLGPMSARSERKLKKLGIHRLIPQDRKAKYFIDLRPMQDEDEALLMITELTCTPGVLSWHMSHLASGVPKTLINGKDGLNVTSKPHHRSWIEVDDVAANDSDGDEENGPTPEQDGTGNTILDLEPEYSALRHYMSIERLLHALHGRDPKLNSAAKVWTYFSIAKFFDCATNTKINAWIYDWLFASNNSNFVQANPEVAYRMASGMRSPDMLRATFTMLVGERALMHAKRNDSDSAILNPAPRSVSVHGRTICHLDDDEINRIDHAAHSLTRRMTALFNYLAHGALDWTPGDSELAKLKFIREWYADKKVVEEPYFLLREYITGEIYQALSQNLAEGDLMRLYRTKGYKEFGWLKRSRTFADSYNCMPLAQRILTQSFWSQLENYGLYQEPEKIAAWSRNQSLRGLDELAPEFMGELTCVTKISLCGAIETMNSLILKDKPWVRKTTSAWSDACQDSFMNQGPETSPDLGCLLPHIDQEIVRAMQGLGLRDETRMGGFLTRPYNGHEYDNDYPYTSVSQQHRFQSAQLAIKPAILLAELTIEMRKRIMTEVLTPGYVNNEMGIESEISISQMDILLCLNEEEWKYLPLWAGGLDDGSGGVFAELDVPDMDAMEGFRGGKMGLGGASETPIGSVGGSFSMAGDSDDFDQVMTDEGVSTIGKASRIATDGTTSAGASTVISLDE